MRQYRDSPVTHDVPHQTPKSSNTSTEDEKKLEQLNTTKLRKENELFNEKRELNQLRRDLRVLQDEGTQAEREKASRNGWWTYMASFVATSAQETQEQKLERERREVDRRAAQTIKERMFERQDSKVKSSEASLQSIKDEIAKIEMSIWMKKCEEEQVRMRQAQMEEQEKIRQAQMRAAQAAQEVRRANEERIRREYQESIRAAEAARTRRQEEMKREEQERIRKESELKRASQAREGASAKKREEQAELRAKRAQGSSNNSSPFTATSSACNHRAFWAQIEGAQRCSRCTITTTKFAFECPGCRKVACADCRRIIRGEAPRLATHQRHRKGNFR